MCSRYHGNFFFHYEFTLPNGRAKNFDIELDHDTLDLITPERGKSPEWTKLSRFQCEHCPLSRQTHEFCPIARNAMEVFDFFREDLSYDRVHVRIITHNRTYEKTIALQYALSSVIGIYMVTSGCPVMDKLRPLVRMHLPFAETEETTYRILSMYLLAQFFREKRGLKPDWKMEDLAVIFREIQTVNKCFLKRLRATGMEDAGLNAVHHLDCHAQYWKIFLSDSGLDNIERFFRAYLELPPEAGSEEAA